MTTRQLLVLEARSGEYVEHVAARALSALKVLGHVPCYVIHNDRRIPVHPGDTPEEVHERAKSIPAEEPGTTRLEEPDRLLVWEAMQRANAQKPPGSATPVAIAAWIDAFGVERAEVVARFEHLRTSLRGLGNVLAFAAEEAAR